MLPLSLLSSLTSIALSKLSEQDRISGRIVKSTYLFLNHFIAIYSPVLYRVKEAEAKTPASSNEFYPNLYPKFSKSHFSKSGPPGRESAQYAATPNPPPKVGTYKNG